MRRIEPGFVEAFFWYDLAMRIDISHAIGIVGAPFARPDARIYVESVRDSRSLAVVGKFDRADLSEPVILATIGGFRLLVDGRHRCKKALVLGKKTLPCYILTERETASCFDGPQQKGRYRRLRDLLKKVEIKVDVDPRSVKLYVGK